MEQVEEPLQQPTGTHTLTFRDSVDLAIVFGCIPALVLSVMFWAIATAFSQASVLATIMVLLITLLLSLMGIVLLVRYVDVCAINVRKYNAEPSNKNSEEQVMFSVGAGMVCGFLAIGIVACLAMAGTLEGWHYTLMAVEVLLVGYQTWRVFLGHQHS